DLVDTESAGTDSTENEPSARRRFWRFVVDVPAWPRTWRYLLDEFERRFLANETLRWLYLGYNRSAQLWQSIVHHTPPPGDGWDWSTAEKRWTSSSIKERHLESLPSYEKEVADMAASYFLDRKATDRNRKELTNLVRDLSSTGAIVILVLPPSDRLFQAEP